MRIYADDITTNSLFEKYSTFSNAKISSHPLNQNLLLHLL